MYFEYLGITSALGGVLKGELTMFVGPFSSEKARETFLQKCHKVISKEKKNPNQIKFILHDKLPISKPDENEFELTDEGEFVPARPLQWGASSPADFLEFLKEL